jgi:hypothetical protein
MRIRPLAAAALVVAVACGGGGPFREYEYEEEVFLSLDGSATVYVNSSVAALDALRGTSFDPRPRARLDRNEVRRLYETSVSHVTRVTASRRHNRRFVHLRVEVDDVRRLGEAGPFAWSAYELQRDGDLVKYRQSIGAPAEGLGVGEVGWTGRELVAFRLHLPSEITYHNAGAENLRRGNILVWEQPLADRLRGAPLTLEVRMAGESILYRTLLLFGVTLAAVVIAFAGVILWVLRRGSRRPARGAVRHDHAV